VAKCEEAGYPRVGSGEVGLMRQSMESGVMAHRGSLGRRSVPIYWYSRSHHRSR